MGHGDRPLVEQMQVTIYGMVMDLHIGAERVVGWSG